MSVPMEFWGVEVKAGQVVKVDQTELLGVTIHLSQIALGESKKDKGSEPVITSLKVGDNKFVLGTLTRDAVPQFALDLYLDSEFEISHNSKNSSVYFSGYKVENDFDNVSDFSDSDDDEDIPLLTKIDGNKVETAADPKKDIENKSDDNSDDDSDEIDADSDDEIDSDEEDDDEDESEDEETPVQKVDQSKKRPNGPASKAPIPAKKAKNATPEKNDGGKKNVQKSTPHPVKKGGKNFNNKKGQRS